MLLSELDLLPLRVSWWRCLRFWNKMVAVPLNSFQCTVLVDNSQCFRVRNFPSSVAIALQSVGHTYTMPAGCTWAVLPTLDVHAVVSGPDLELSVRLPDPVCLDPDVPVAWWCSVHISIGFCLLEPSSGVAISLQLPICSEVSSFQTWLPRSTYSHGPAAWDTWVS